MQNLTLLKKQEKHGNSNQEINYTQEKENQNKSPSNDTRDFFGGEKKDNFSCFFPSRCS